MKQTEMDKLYEYLIAHHYCVERIVDNNEPFIRNQIIAYDSEGNKLWDVICHPGSIGYKYGLLEAMGDIVNEPDNDVEGYLTAQDVIQRLEVLYGS